MAEQDHSVPQTVILHGNVSKQSDINWLIGKVAVEIAEANLLRSLLPCPAFSRSFSSNMSNILRYVGDTASRPLK